jgi:micrococcal nuclease
VIDAPLIPTPTASPVADFTCDPSYPDVCIPAAPPNLTCDDIPLRGFTVSGSDPHGFDPDGNGIGCEADTDTG